MERWTERTRLLLGDEKLGRLRSAHVLVVGLGGVGAYAAEMIVRAGAGRLTIADADHVAETNINRQLVALHSTVGRPKAEVLAERLRDINPDLQLTVIEKYIRDEETDRLLDAAPYDYAVDAIDTLSPKLALIKGCLDRGIPLVSSMGAGAKTDPTRMEIADIGRTHHCPLAHMLRTCTRRGDAPLRGAEQEIERGNDLLPARALRHRLRIGRGTRPAGRNGGFRQTGKQRLNR